MEGTNEVIDIKQIDPFSLPSVELKEIDKMPQDSGIYFAILEAKILYIGKASNLRHRWQWHHRTAQLVSIGNVSIAWMSLPELEGQNLEGLEEECIKYFKPALNRTNITRKAEVCELRVSFGKKLQQLYRQKGFTQEQLASASRLSDRQIRRIERGTHAASLDTIERLAEVLEMPVKELFDFSD